MSGNAKSYLSFLFMLLFGACQSNSCNQGGADLNLPNGYTSVLRTVVVNDTTLIDTLRYLYSIKNYQPALIKTSSDKKIVNDIISILNGSKAHGIDPSIYNVNEIENEFHLANDTSFEGLRHLAMTELLCTKGIVNYSNHLRYGIINPVKLVSGYYIPVTDSSDRRILESLNEPDLYRYFERISPKSLRYVRMQNALKKFDTLESYNWEKITNSTQSNEIIERLSLLGFADYKDTLIINKVRFKEAIKNFQRSYGLIPDGNIGKPTLDKLNLTPREYIEKIQLNMERFRWTNYTDSSKYVLVNIPDFYLHVIEGGKEKFNIKVCTGKKRPGNYSDRYQNYLKTGLLRHRPDDWETPQLMSEISYLILNPTWTVPFNIVREEIYSGVMKDSLYLQKRNFKAFSNGKEVSLDNLDIRKYSPERVPFTFVQGAGNGNALGKIKFMFRNGFDVYLHDTPTRPPFSRTNRAVSHGCIRVEKPFQLAEYLLQDNSRWTLDYIKIETGQSLSDKSKIEEYNKFKRGLGFTSNSNITKEVRLFQKVPVVIDYYTSWVDENGIINIRDDVYDKDKALKKVLLAKAIK